MSMTNVDPSVVRKLAQWNPDGIPITSVYLTVDGRRYPRKSDYEVRLDDLLRRGRAQAEGEGLSKEALRSVLGDLEAIDSFVRDEFERGDTRGLALFSANAAGLWEEVRLPRPVRDRATVASAADVLPLEQVLETYRPMCLALVDYEKARVFLSELGRVEEVTDVIDDVPGRHDQGGWSQMRMQRHVDDHRQRHLKRVADALFRLLKASPFDSLVLAGPAEAHLDLERNLHPYLRDRIRAGLTLAMTATADEVAARCLEVEEEQERTKEAAKVEALRAAAESGGKAVTGLPGTLAAVAEGRAAEILVGLDLSAPGFSCPSCGRLTERGTRCPACGSTMEPVADVVEEAVARAVRQGSRVETIVHPDGLARYGGIGALLRF
ncbi:MAG TPA: Vms1/Ankzf1 family peptidyl-tRNA hydrolase [Actinomycetota bacterium]|jgi:peptide chain release factor subunit 1|nr:Vms1/Ankzf1 family peptidyl-tRNA hydrolase [Actinomycetota bacterium]